MNTKHLMRKLPSCLLGAILAAGIASSTTVNAVDGDPPGLFELEGNILVNDGPGTDWSELYELSQSVPPGEFPENMVTFTGITADPAPQTVYWKGGSKDINDVSEWWYKDGSVPDKDDITNAYAAAFTNPNNVCFDGTEAVACSGDMVPVHEAGDLIVYFGLDRFANDGDAFAGFWFFQDEVATNGNNQFTGNHMEGDILVLVEYPQGANASPQIKVYKWVDSGGDVAPNLLLLASDTDAACDGFGGKLACAKTNPLDLPADPDPIPWAYTPKSGTGLPHESFYEGGINVTQLLGSTPCFAAFLAETRASRSETATLKDFVIDDFPVCGAEVEKKCLGAPVLSEDKTEVTVNFQGNVLNTGGQSVFVELDDNQDGSAFTTVCFDNDNNDICDAVVPPGPTDVTTGATATFTLGAGQRVHYEGNYTTAVTTLSYSDEVTMKFFSAGTLTLIDTKTAEATCLLDLTPGIEVTKECDPEGGGVRLVAEGGEVLVEVDNLIKVKNTGDEKLVAVAITDTESGIQSLTDNSDNISCSITAGVGECIGFLNVGEEVTINQTYRPDGQNITGSLVPSEVYFNNTATAVGDGAITGTQDVTDSDDASCPLCPPHDGS
ncbi:conserved exported hypothetical protein [Pseudomonas sp. 8AS]|uniref:hypothetical protein n=1 Tax=Pseudomonas sp. 8AS TaxID=2653163 RepID=UPI0012F04570|nr:hypothetical protein [Pseudomonas sp. 8AS]VXB08678.1 conserved exported hypothetical protein [Pseudomonas sp. 8AS]